MNSDDTYSVTNDGNRRDDAASSRAPIHPGARRVCAIFVEVDMIGLQRGRSVRPLRLSEVLMAMGPCKWAGIMLQSPACGDKNDIIFGARRRVSLLPVFGYTSCTHTRQKPNYMSLGECQPSKYPLEYHANLRTNISTVWGYHGLSLHNRNPRCEETSFPKLGL